MKEKHIPIEEELKNSYLTYAMSVIVSRALPDVRDGLKPSQRRILVATNDLKLGPKSKYRKCAKISGDTSGNYHPHGEAVIYPTLVRMAQTFNMRYPLIDGQGNFGSLDGDPPAAMRYTEARMTSISMELLEDLYKDTVDFVSNYDGTIKEPVVLPGKFPNLLVNGSVGIAVGMSTSIPSHNLGEVCDGIIEVIEHPNIAPIDLCNIIKGPDFPTGSIICGRDSIKKAYCTGNGTIKIKAKYTTEEKKGKSQIIFTSIPPRLNKANILQRIAELVKTGTLKGISDVRDESDRNHLVRIVVELKKGENPEVIVNQLYKFTTLQSSFPINMIALVNGRPELLNIKQMISHFIEHRQVIIRRKTAFLLKKAEKRAHIVDGLMIAIEKIDDVIETIRSTTDAKSAKESLMEKYKLSSPQSDSVLQMRLSSLTSLEYSKLKEEREELTKKIEDLKKYWKMNQKFLKIIKEETIELKNRYGSPRMTQIGQEFEKLEMEDIIADDQWVVIVTHKGYIKRMSPELYRNQNRGGTGVSGTNMQEEDFVEHFFTASAHEYILFFSDHGKAYLMKVYNIPESSRNSKGRAIVNLLSLDKDEVIASLLPVRNFDDRLIIMATAQGIVKKTKLSAFSRSNKSGLKAIIISPGDKLISVKITKGNDRIILATSLGRVCHFEEQDVRTMGRATRGVRGCRLGKEDYIIGMVVVNPEESLLTICENGYAKRTDYEEYRITKRGGKGVLNLKRTPKTGNVVSILSVQEDDEIMAVTHQGMIIRTSAQVSKISRVTQGVKLIKLKNDDKVVNATKLAKEDFEEETPSE